ncbi:[citrate (pro-3S)-lyase] ligase [Azotosporobacter soli]|uniref:[citrate (pro-3S)-lyase] ligase n=1 Tax=Azotosporobacter soli TaxID=3055040 RepID=UPI0031FEBBDA
MLWGQVEERSIDLANQRQVGQVREFLAPFSLSFDGLVDYTVGFYRDGKLVATGSRKGEVLRNIAVDESLQGEGLTASVVSHLMKQASRQGLHHYFLFTKPSTAAQFTALGFKEIARSEPHAVLLETGMGSVASYCKDLANKAAILPKGNRAALVVNCNPFTLGHKAVIAKAAAENDAVIVFVVSEEGSLFPFSVRYRLVQEGVREYKNVLVLPGGPYIISAATFPAYFTRGDAAVAAQTRLDVTVFAHHIAPALGVTRRYVGTEPYCAVTDAYNLAMMDILPEYGVELREMPRVMTGDKVISASTVRELIKKDDWENLRELVPETTYQYLISEEAAEVIRRVKGSASRH